MEDVYLDSCVVIDILCPESNWHQWAIETVNLDKDIQRLISPVVFAEICAPMPSIHDALQLLDHLELSVSSPNYEALYLASKKQLEYRKRGGRKTSVPDFFIGAQATVERVPLITRDVARFNSYFPSLEVIAPVEN